MESFLYIIVAILWIAFSLYRSQKKQREKAMLKTETEVNSNAAINNKAAIGDLLEEFLGNKGKQFRFADESNANPQNIYTPTTSYDKNISMEAKLSHKTKVEKSPVTPTPISKSRQTIAHVITEEADPISTEFELRKAFFYQTILTRPYS